MHANMKPALVILICLAVVVATTAVRTREEAIAKARRNGGHERQRRNHRDRHKRQNNIVGELDASVATESKHHRNHTHSIGNQNELVAVSGQIDEVHHYNHTHQLKNATDGSVLKTNITHTERNKEKKEKRAKAKAQKTMSNQDVNTTTILPLLAENATTHHKHEGRHEHNQTAKEDDTAQPNATSAAVSEASTKNVTEASSFTTATKMLVPSTSSRAGGEGADPKRAWEEDPQVEAVLAEVEAEFEAKKQQSEEIMGQQMMNSASTFTIGLSIIVGVVVQTIAHHLIV